MLGTLDREGVFGRQVVSILESFAAADPHTQQGLGSRLGGL